MRVPILILMVDGQHHRIRFTAPAAARPIVRKHSQPIFVLLFNSGLPGLGCFLFSGLFSPGDRSDAGSFCCAPCILLGAIFSGRFRVVLNFVPSACHIHSVPHRAIRVQSPEQVGCQIRTLPQAHSDEFIDAHFHRDRFLDHDVDSSFHDKIDDGDGTFLADTV